MDKASRMRRARDMGFNVVAYHGTGSKFNEFSMEIGKANHFGFAPFFADVKDEAKGYADGTEGKVLSVLLRIRKPFMVPKLFTMPLDAATTDLETYKLVTGGHGPNDTDRERYLNNNDAIEHAMDVHYKETGNYDRKQIWTKIYARLKSQGYDAIIWPKTPADHSHDQYTKIAMLDMTGIRLASAAFDPARADSADIRA